MDATQLPQLIDDLGRQEVTCTATHISYVLLHREFAYKIKKTTQLAFLDFSNLAARKHFCEEELRLNRRLAPEVYLDVVPIRDTGTSLSLAEEAEGEIVDYAVKMQRLDNRREMDKLLERRQVTASQLDALAATIASFHATAEVIATAPDLSGLKATFNAIDEQLNFVEEHLGASYAQVIKQAIGHSNQFLEAHIDAIKRRSRQGLVRDVHGDLHSKNIFLYDEKPIVFDCIEFDAHLRQIDLLNEVAFLCMDLETRGAAALSQYFYQRYTALTTQKNLAGVGHTLLFDYFKLYRANVRAKIAAIDAEAHLSTAAFAEKKPELISYLDYMKQCLRQK